MRWTVILAVLVVFLSAWSCTALAATANLTWTDNSTNELGFTVERKAVACGTVGTWTQLATPPANATTFHDAIVSDGMSYCYRVNAWNTVDGTPTGTKQYSPWSNEAGITLPFALPAGPGQLGVTLAP